MTSRAACAALDHVAKEAMFSCDNELDRWSVLGFFCAKPLSFSELLFGLGSLAFNVSAEMDCMGFLQKVRRAFGKRFEVHPSLARWKEREVGAQSQRVQQMRSQHVAFTERNAVLNKIHEALADATFHSDQTEILEEIVEKLEESFDGASPESCAETPVDMAVPQESYTDANCGCIDDRFPVIVCHKWGTCSNLIFLFVSVRTCTLR